MLFITMSDLTNPNLPPHLSEVCDILARGLLRLRSHTSDKTDAPPADQGERLLHFTAHQRRHANPTKRRDA